MIEGDFDTIPVEIKLASTITPRSLRGLEGFMADNGSRYGLLINRGKRVERLTDKIIQIPIGLI